MPATEGFTLFLSSRVCFRPYRRISGHLVVCGIAVMSRCTQNASGLDFPGSDEGRTV